MSSEGWVQRGVSWGQTGSSADSAEARCAQAVADRLPYSQLVGQALYTHTGVFGLERTGVSQFSLFGDKFGKIFLTFNVFLNFGFC